MVKIEKDKIINSKTFNQLASKLGKCNDGGKKSML
jgi:hypothetical protein